MYIKKITLVAKEDMLILEHEAINNVIAKDITTCIYCGKEMTYPNTVTCEVNEFITYPDGTKLPSVKCSLEDVDESGRCWDCNVVPGANHHIGCENGVCPKCGGQLLICDCYMK